MGTPVGRLEVVCGPMFSGKTTELIGRVAAARARGLMAVVLKPAQDGRYAAGQVVSHAGARLEAVPVADAGGVAAGAGDAAVVGIDEAHFFGAELVAPVGALVAAGRRVIVAGLERDHRGRAFEPLPALLCEADEVVKLVGRCAVCGGPAVHSQRLVESSERIVVGGAGDYEPRCRACFVPGK